MIVLGIDPGETLIGFGVIKKDGARIVLLEYGCIVIPTGTRSSAEKLHELETKLTDVIRTHKPDIAGIENLFFFKSLKTTIKVAQARGVILATCQRNAVEVFEFTPLQIKQAVTGYGKAEKRQGQRMVQIILGMAETPKQDDAADALAAAICAHNSCALLKKLKQS